MHLAVALLMLPNRTNALFATFGLFILRYPMIIKGFLSFSYLRNLS